jgi:superfamily I DNA and RNA helicase
MVSELITNSVKFITTESLDKNGEKGEILVWEAIQENFARRECLAYWRYPIFSQTGKQRKEPDILIADRELGLIIIEIKSLQIEQIVSINGHRWQYQNFYTNFGNPYQQAENQLFTLLEYTNKEPVLAKKITGRVLIALPYITQAQWQDKKFAQLPTNPPIIFQEDLANPNLVGEKISSCLPVIYGQKINDQQWRLLLSILAGSSVFTPCAHRVLASPQSKGKILAKLRKYSYQLDLEQEKIAKQIPAGIQRIKGIAGSGKTVLLCQKAAHLHLKHPDWKIALVFFSRSLYQQIREQVDCWLGYFSNNQINYHDCRQNLLILHGWGSKQQPGFYSFICQSLKATKLRLKDTISQQPNEALGEACYQLLKTRKIPSLFDAILIDEAQDLVVNNWLFEGKQPFFWLAYQSLRPIDSINQQQRRLIYAYDEMQNLANCNHLTPSKLFGEKVGNLLAGKYDDEINKTEIINHSYRTPESILNVAFAMNMGWLRPLGMLTTIKDNKIWQEIGYQLQGKLACNEKINITRIKSVNNNPLTKFSAQELIKFQTFYSRQEELSYLAESILDNLRFDGLRPCKNILVIILGNNYQAQQLQKDTAKVLHQKGIAVFLPHNKRENYDQFWQEGAVTVSRIYQAKGNEADQVYLIGLDHIAQQEANLSLRNQLFIALTRSKAWVNLSGVGKYVMYEELKQVIASGNSFTFTVRNLPERQLKLSLKTELIQRFALGYRDFPQIDLTGINLESICLEKINLIGSNLSETNLRFANLRQAKLINTNLSNSDLTGINLTQAKLINANLKGANLTQANLREADLSYADLSEAILDNVNLEQADLTETILPHY